MVSAESQAAMDNAAKAVREFLSKNGHKDTTVYELVRPGITHEVITRNEREEHQVVTDVERHQTHFHTSLQPVTDEETLDLVHEARIGPVENRVFEHDDREEVQRRLDSEAAKYFSHTERVQGEHTREDLPVVAGEHIHHHVREYIQPIVNRQVIEPRIIHSVTMVHEIHHNAAIHHKTSVLPAVTMDEFKRQGGVLTGREERFDFFEGEPRSVGGVVGNAAETTTSGAAGDRETAGSGPQSGYEIPQTESHTTSGPQPPYPVPQRRSTQPQTPMPTTEVNQGAAAQAAQSLGGPAQPAASQAPTQSAQPRTSANTAAIPARGPATGGKWSLMPMQFPRGNDTTHPPTRAAQHTVPGMHAIYPPRPSVDQPRTGSSSTQRPDASQGGQGAPQQ